MEIETRERRKKSLRAVTSGRSQCKTICKSETFFCVAISKFYLALDDVAISRIPFSSRNDFVIRPPDVIGQSIDKAYDNVELK